MIQTNIMLDSKNDPIFTHLAALVLVFIVKTVIIIQSVVFFHKMINNLVNRMSKNARHNFLKSMSLKIFSPINHSKTKDFHFTMTKNRETRNVLTPINDWNV